MEYYDHGMVGATLAVAVGAQRRHGWPVVVLAALAAMFPDWDALSKHISADTYHSGHRAWGHNLFAVTLAGLLLGGLGYWIHQSVRRGADPPRAHSRLGSWLLLAVAIMWTHPLLDVLYCGLGQRADWPVRLFWPVVNEGFARPWVPWNDRGATLLLCGGLAATLVATKHRRSSATIALGILTLYVAIRGAWVQWT
jgi:membrane-bound metal-dependent hydrolase YbcI (DUF457 family)